MEEQEDKKKFDPKETDDQKANKEPSLDSTEGKTSGGDEALDETAAQPEKEKRDCRDHCMHCGNHCIYLK